MKTNIIQPSFFINKNQFENSPTTKNSHSNFMSYLKTALNEVDALQKEATFSASQLILGEEENLHNTVLAYEKANLALQLTIEVRNKIVEAFQEIMRIQM
ncbi:MAG TPA: flagellar hook-basal body complex protein FliE [Syntrophomonadaceae bacterium]|nr:flagellar hook-basal body complex protein FliE [Syntrophomonadaceae bacterium]